MKLITFYLLLLYMIIKCQFINIDITFTGMSGYHVTYQLPEYVFKVLWTHKAGGLQALEDLDKWNVDIFRIAELSNNQPLTCVMYNIFVVSQRFAKEHSVE